MCRGQVSKVGVCQVRGVLIPLSIGILMVIYTPTISLMFPSPTYWGFFNTILQLIEINNWNGSTIVSRAHLVEHMVLFCLIHANMCHSQSLRTEELWYESWVEHPSACEWPRTRHDITSLVILRMLPQRLIVLELLVGVHAFLLTAASKMQGLSKGECLEPYFPVIGTGLRIPPLHDNLEIRWLQMLQILPQDSMAKALQAC